MREELIHLGGEFILLLIGGLVSSASWIVKLILKTRKDLDCAHAKIRMIEQYIKQKEKDNGC